MKITHIEQGSFAERLGLFVGDAILTLNRQPVRDAIDFQYLIHDDTVILEVDRTGHRLTFSFQMSLEEPFGAEFESFKYRCCGNHCVFCFVDQNPSGLRRALYLKDEDYRLSFLYGNYVTLTTVSQRDLNRIVEQRLSPLYISVHAVDNELRRRLLGLRRDDRLLEKISFLAEQRIEMHAQIVLCPAWNDGTYLEQTVNKLAEFFPWVKTVAIVPVGLTRHRERLSPLEAVTTVQAMSLIRWVNEMAAIFLKKFGSYFIYLADEFYFLARQPIPAAERYEDFSQIENGVGMTRAFLDRFEEEAPGFPLRLPATAITLISGAMFSSVIESQVLPVLRNIKNLVVNFYTIQNHFYGETITVTGLLTGQDIVNQLLHRELGDRLFVPPDCLNADGLFLDDYALDRLAEELGVLVSVAPDSFKSLMKELE